MMPERREHTFACNLCESVCGMRVSVEAGRVVSVRPDPEDVFSRGHICPKGPALRELHDDPDRLRAPVRRTSSGWEPIAWDDAFELIGRELGAVRARHGRDAVGLYVGNPTVHSHRSALGAQLFTAALGTKNRFDPNSQDSAPRLFACREVYGDIAAIPVPDIDRTEHLLILGANPVASNGSMMALGDARGRLRGIKARGGRVVLVDPRRHETAALADEHHFLRPGSDAPLLLAMLQVLFAESLVDEAAVARVASGLPALREVAARFPPERVSAASCTAALAPVRTPSARRRAGSSRCSTSSRATSIAREGPCSRPRRPTSRGSRACSSATRTTGSDRACGACRSCSARCRRR
jgi:anaerobic selenocysteine-containing dehydrogenase